jgi:hypothetical protein
MWLDEFNRPCWGKFLTLTFGDHITDIDVAMREFTLSIKRLNYALCKSKKAAIKYLGVIEFQKNGRVHFHVIFFNMPYVDRIIDVFNEVWGKGHMVIRAVDHVKDVGLYISKYMTKADDVRLEGRKRYFTSRGLLGMRKISDQEAVRSLSGRLPKAAIEYDRTYESKHTGKTRYLIFNLERYPELKNAIIAKYEALRHPKKS